MEGNRLWFSLLLMERYNPHSELMEGNDGGYNGYGSPHSELMEGNNGYGSPHSELMEGNDRG